MHASEIWHSKSAIRKAQARLAYQRKFVRRLGPDVDPSFVSVANETVAMMEARLSRLRAAHASLLEERGRPAPTGATIRAAARS